MNKYRFYIEEDFEPTQYEAFASSLKELWTKVQDVQLAYVKDGNGSTYIFNGARRNLKASDLKFSGGRRRVGASRVGGGTNATLIIEIVK